MPKDNLESIWKGVIHKLHFKLESGIRTLKQASLSLKQYYFEIGVKI